MLRSPYYRLRSILRKLERRRILLFELKFSNHRKYQRTKLDTWDTPIFSQRMLRKLLKCIMNIFIDG
jgi:hypothetical protein